MQLPAIYRLPQGLAGRKQMLLARIVVQSRGPQAAQAEALVTELVAVALSVA